MGAVTETHCFRGVRVTAVASVASAGLRGRGSGPEREHIPDSAVECPFRGIVAAYNATLAMFERQGFVRTRQLAKNGWLVTKKVRAKRTTS